MRCDQVADALAAAADGSTLLPRDERHHVEHCLRCQAELVQYRKLLRALRALRTEVIEPVPGLLPELLAAIGEEAERHGVRSVLAGRRVAYLAAAATAATAAAAGGAIVLASRRGRLRLAS